MDADRALPKDRLTSLSSHQEAFLNAFSTLLATQLFVGVGAGAGTGAGAGAGSETGNTQVVASLEKRSVALRLTVEMVRLAPAEHMPVACSQVSKTRHDMMRHTFPP